MENIEIVVTKTEQHSDRKMGYDDTVEIAGSGFFSTKKLSTEDEKTLLTETQGIIERIANGISQSFKKMEDASEMQIEFGLSFSEKLGIRIFEVAANQSLTVTIKYTKPSKP